MSLGPSKSLLQMIGSLRLDIGTCIGFMLPEYSPHGDSRYINTIIIIIFFTIVPKALQDQVPTYARHWIMSKK